MKRAWTAEEPFSEITPYGDWDSIASMIGSLRIHLFEYGTVPIWNFMFCGGQPELATPYSWAYTWPSLIGYAMPPNWAIVSVWLLMTGVGLLSAKTLFHRWTGSRLAAWTGAILYAFSGHFAARFNVGHVTFAFYHLIPLMMLLFEAGLEQRVAGRRAARYVVASTLTAFLFFSAGLPHGLMHFYPAFLLLVSLRLVAGIRAEGVASGLRAAMPLMTSQLLGVWLAAYKLWPVIRWQMEMPRKGVGVETYGLLDVLRSSLHFVSEYDTSTQQAWQLYPPPEYNAFVGLVPWLLAGVAIVALAIRRPRPRGFDVLPTWFSLALIAIGIDLSLGNGNAASAASLFRHAPLLDGIRIFSRFQIFVVFGLAMLAAQGITSIQRAASGSRAAQVFAYALAVIAAAPVLAQAMLLVWNLPAASDPEVLAPYGITTTSQPPQLIGRIPRHGRDGWLSVGSVSALVERGYWIASCYGNLSLPSRAKVRPGAKVSLTSPPPTRVARLGRDSLTLEVPKGRAGPLLLDINVMDSFEFSTPPAKRAEGVTVFRLADLRDGLLTVRARHPGPAAGLWASIAGLAVCLLLLAWWIAPQSRRRAIT